MKTLNYLNELTRNVERILEVYPKSRVNDNYLIYRLITENDPVTKNYNFTQLEEYLENNNISFESITRARRKVQSERPELKDENVASMRTEQIEIFKTYSKG